MAFSYDPPVAELPAFHKLEMPVQREIRFTLKALKAIDAAPRGKIGAAMRAQARAAASAGYARGLDPKSLERKRKLFHKSNGDWTVLVDRNKVKDWSPEQRCRVDGISGALPAEFKTYWCGLCQENNRSGRQAHDKLIRQWYAGESIPGYGMWWQWFMEQFPNRPLPPACPPELPEGWSYDTLMRYAPHPVVMALARRGIAAGLEEIPSMVRTRAGLMPMQYVVLDDWRCDWRVHVPGVEEACMLNGILAMDVATATCLRFGIRPSVPREDGSHEGLIRLDTKSIIASILMTYGYPTDYKMTFIVERGTATISPDDAQAIYEVTNGQVLVRFTSMISGRVFGFEDRAVGNFRGKAWLESFFNLLHNACGDIPGQIGAHYSIQPSEIHGRSAMNKVLVKAQAQIPAALQNALQYRFPFPGVAESRDALNYVFNVLNNRTRHELEGFDQTIDFRFGEMEQWISAAQIKNLQIPPEVIERMPSRPRPESPMERRDRKLQGVTFKRVHPSCGPRLIENHKLVTVEKEGELNLGTTSKPIYYRDRTSPYLKPGNKFLAYINTQDDEWIQITTGKGAYVCSLRKERAVAQGDAEATSKAIAEKTGQLKRAIAEARRNDLTAPRQLADIEHNLALATREEAVDLVPVPVAAGVNADVPEFAQVIATARGAVQGVRNEQIAEANARKARHLAEAGDYQDLASAPARAPASSDSAYGVSMAELNDL